MANSLEDLLLGMYNEGTITAEDAVKLKEQHVKQTKLLPKQKPLFQYKVVVQLSESETDVLEFEATMHTVIQDMFEFYDNTGLVLAMPKSRLVYIDISEL
jgi:hypothetical protein